jgi:hexosaminidase
LASPRIIPQPAILVALDGAFTLPAEASLSTSPAFSDEAEALRSRLRASTGFALPFRRQGQIRLIQDSKLKSLGSEGYRLKVGEDGVEIRAAGKPGAFYGVQTLLQLFPAGVFRAAKTEADWTLPHVEIEDKPRFQWRGAMLDVARHFVPKESVLKFLDLMALHKLNRFHWHLTDDQGWRIEINRYPRLTSVGAWRKDTMLTYDPPTYADKPHGGFYTQEDVKEIVAYAAARHIVVVPEIEMPGHAQAAIAAYPELGNTGEQLEVGVKWGVYENVFNVEDSTIEFLQNVLAEVIQLFPGPFVHIGGDECPKVQWKNSPRAQARMKELGLRNEEELQSWFIRQMDAFLDKKGKRLIGWSEISEGGLAEGATLMVWLGDEGAMHAVSSGHDVVMAQTSHMYLDYYQADPKKEPHAIGGFLPIEKVYSYNPILPAMTAEQAKHVLGVQFQLWSEYFPNFKHVEYMAFPRGCAAAEVAWSPQESRNFVDFSQRLPFHLERLRVLDVNFRPLDSGK